MDKDAPAAAAGQGRLLGKLSVRNFTPKTVKKGTKTTERKQELQRAFVEKNSNLADLQERCKHKRLSLRVTYYLNRETPDSTSYKKDLDNLLKLLMDVIKEEMDDDQKNTGLGLVLRNMDEEIFEINCSKQFVSGVENEGIDLEISEWMQSGN